ncbi:hypothetical protein LTR08_000402 [Meristemomyces frigidus]|nr:hypothetical protein LTR08_000402 [Meristemomyces frigidus]
MRTIRPGFFRRTFASTPAIRSSWSTGPSPPRLPKEEQELFEKLQQSSSGAFSAPKTAKPEVQPVEPVLAQSSEAGDMLAQLRQKAQLAAKGDGEELHPNIRRGAAPEFEGDVNPKTGEAGGPKNEPLRWGAGSDWSYNGRVTDF